MVSEIQGNLIPSLVPSITIIIGELDMRSKGSKKPTYDNFRSNLPNQNHIILEDDQIRQKISSYILPRPPSCP